MSAQSAYANFAMGFVLSATQVIFVVHHPKTMRAAPAFTYSAPAHFAAVGAVSSLVQDVAGTDVSRLLATTSGAPTGQGTNLQASGTALAWLAFAAEL